MLHTLARNWWAVLLRGIAAVCFGLLAFFWPGATTIALVILFGAYAFVDGIFALVSAVRAVEAHERWGALLIEGIIGIIIAAITFFYPGITLFALYWLIAVWAVLTGIMEIAAAVRLRKMVPNEWLLIIAGVLSIAFGVLLVIYPLVGLLTVIYLIGAYALIFGIMLIGFSFRLRSFNRNVPAV